MPSTPGMPRTGHVFPLIMPVLLASGGYAVQGALRSRRYGCEHGPWVRCSGSVLSFLLPDNLESEVQVRLAGFGRGKVESSDGLLVVDSEADASAQKTMALYARDRETPVTFTGHAA